MHSQDMFGGALQSVGFDNDSDFGFDLDEDDLLADALAKVERDSRQPSKQPLEKHETCRSVEQSFHLPVEDSTVKPDSIGGPALEIGYEDIFDEAFAGIIIPKSSPCSKLTDSSV